VFPDQGGGHRVTATAAPVAGTEDAARPGDAEQAHRLPVRLWILAFAGFFLFGAAWALANPMDGSPDETQHLWRAAGAVHGDFFPRPAPAVYGTGAFMTVPERLYAMRCSEISVHLILGECQRDPGEFSREYNEVATYTGRYNGLYYVIVGWPLRFWPNWTGIYLARLINAAMVAGLLAAAATAAARWSRYRAAVAGLLVGLTPMALHLAGSVNPNSVEIGAGLLLFAALIPPLLDPQVPVRRSALIQSGVAAAVLATVRFGGPLWLVVALGVLLVPTRRALLRRLATNRGVRWWLVGTAVALFLGLAWTLVFRAYEMAPQPVDRQYALAALLKRELFERFVVVNNQMIGVLAYLDLPIRGPVYLIWSMLAGLLILAAVAFGRWIDRWRVLALLVATYGIPTLNEVLTANGGFGTQGRYLLVTAGGITMIAAVTLAHRGVLDRVRSYQLIRLIALITVPIQAYVVYYALVAWTNGVPQDPADTPVNPFHGQWAPTWGVALPLVLTAVGAAALLLYVWFITRLPREGDNPVREPVVDGESVPDAHPGRHRAAGAP
jgi:hypothetical protein